MLAAIFLFAANCFAGDYATLNVIGFSKDGRYLAFEEYGTQDGSGFPYSTIYFIDTQRNAYAGPSVAVRLEKETASETMARKRSALLATKKLRQLGIIKGNTGKVVVSHLMTDQTFDDASDDKKANLVKFAEEVQSMHREGDYELLLTPIPAKDNDCEVYGDVFMLDLKLTNKTDDTSTFLQKDTSLPKSRGCPLSYRIQDVYLYQDFIAVFANVFTQGFEGPDMRFLAVTGKFR
jgi:predicted secreted protein